MPVSQNGHALFCDWLVKESEDRYVRIFGMTPEQIEEKLKKMEESYHE
jgi:hypothetical protein